MQRYTTLWLLLAGVLLGSVIALIAIGKLQLPSSDDGVKKQAEASRTSAAKRADTSFRADSTTLASCDLATDVACATQALGNIAVRKGGAAALRELTSVVAAWPTVQQSCHTITHKIGAAALARAKGSVGAALAEGSAICGSGYYHGLLADALSDTPASKLTATVRGVCDDPSIQPGSFVEGQCLHGLGHGLMVYRSYDVPKALKACDRLPTKNQTSCGSGVLMENFSPAFQATSPWRDSARPTYPCAEIDAKYEQPCYSMAGAWIISSTNMNWTASGKICAAVEKSGRGYCYESLGGYATGFSSYDVGKVISACQQVGGMVDRCMLGAGQAYTHNTARPNEASAFCMASPAELRGGCFVGMGRIMSTLERSPARQQQVCRRWASSNLADCRRGFGLTA